MSFFYFIVEMYTLFCALVSTSISSMVARHPVCPALVAVAFVALVGLLASTIQLIHQSRHQPMTVRRLSRDLLLPYFLPGPLTHPFHTILAIVHSFIPSSSPPLKPATRGHFTPASFAASADSVSHDAIWTDGTADSGAPSPLDVDSDVVVVERARAITLLVGIGEAADDVAIDLGPSAVDKPTYQLNHGLLKFILDPISSSRLGPIGRRRPGSLVRRRRSPLPRPIGCNKSIIVMNVQVPDPAQQLRDAVRQRQLQTPSADVSSTGTKMTDMAENMSQPSVPASSMDGEDLTFAGLSLDSTRTFSGPTCDKLLAVEPTLGFEQLSMEPTITQRHHVGSRRNGNGAAKNETTGRAAKPTRSQIGNGVSQKLLSQSSARFAKGSPYAYPGPPRAPVANVEVSKVKKMLPTPVPLPPVETTVAPALPSIGGTSSAPLASGPTCDKLLAVEPTLGFEQLSMDPTITQRHQAGSRRNGDGLAKNETTGRTAKATRSQIGNGVSQKLLSQSSARFAKGSPYAYPGPPRAPVANVEAFKVKKMLPTPISAHPLPPVETTVAPALPSIGGTSSAPLAVSGSN
ncbi:hypothetical protein RQP46_001532 [Phenoliferia psychrophenolica]